MLFTRILPPVFLRPHQNQRPDPRSFEDSLSWPVGIPKEKSENREEEKP